MPDQLTAAPASTRASTVARYLLPSAADLLFIILLVAFTIGALAQRLLGDAGAGWHIRAGETMLHTHLILRTDIFSSTMNGRPWFAWEWLFDIAVGSVHHIAGLNGVVFATALIIAFVFAMLFRFTLHRGSSMAVALVMTVLALFAASIHFFARPHIFSWLFALIWFETLDQAEDSGGVFRHLWLLPLLMLVWVNVHGGFLLGFVLLGLYLLAAVVNWGCAQRSGTRFLQRIWIARLLRIIVVSALATFINPYGYLLHVHIYRYLTDTFLMNHIDEFRSPNFHGMAQQCFVILLLLTVAALAGGTGKRRVSHYFVLIFAILSGLYASRNLPVSSILITLIVAPWLSDALGLLASPRPFASRIHRNLERVLAFDGRMRVTQFGFRGHLWPVIAVLVIAIAALNGGRLGAKQLMTAHFDASRLPVEAANFIADHNITDPIFAPDSWGGYLIYRLYPHNRVVLDDRHDLYGDQFLKDYLHVTNLQAGWQDVLARDRANYVLMPAGSSLANLLRETQGWTELYRDNTAELFRRSGARCKDGRNTMGEVRLRILTTTRQLPVSLAHARAGPHSPCEWHASPPVPLQ